MSGVAMVENPFHPPCVEVVVGLTMDYSLKRSLMNVGLPRSDP